MKNSIIFKKLLTYFSLVFLFSLNLKSALCTSLGNGDWASAANWSCGSVPTCGDSVVILAGHTVTVTTQQDYEACGSGPHVVVYGVLKFDNGNKLKLPCDARIYIMMGGSIQPGTGGGNSNFIEICNDVLWNAASGTLSGPSCLPANAPWCLNVVLPVEFVNFTGDVKDGYIDLFWNTATEKNSCCFDIERSADASSFKKIITANSKAVNGNSQSFLSYSAVDNSPLNSICYYRIKQIDRDNTFSYSNIISINYIKAKNVKFIIYPNPNKGEFTADISGIENNHKVTISLMDEKGNTVYNSSFFIHDPNSSKIQIIPENKLTNGIYICSLIIEDIQYHVNVVVS